MTSAFILTTYCRNFLDGVIDEKQFHSLYKNYFLEYKVEKKIIDNPKQQVRKNHQRGTHSSDDFQQKEEVFDVQEVHRIIKEKGILHLKNKIKKIIEKTGFDFNSPYILNNLNFENKFSLPNTTFSTPTCYTIHNDLLFIATICGKVGIYDMNTFVLIDTIEELDRDKIVSLIVFEEKLYIGYSYIIKIFDIQSKEFLKETFSLKEEIISFNMIFDKIVCISKYHIIIFDINSKELILKFGCKFVNNYYYKTASQEYEFEYENENGYTYKMYNGGCRDLYSVEGKNSNILALTIQNFYFYTAHDDKIIRKWDIFNLPNGDIIYEDEIEKEIQVIENDIAGVCDKDTSKIEIINDNMFAIAKNIIISSFDRHKQLKKIFLQTNEYKPIETVGFRGRPQRGRECNVHEQCNIPKPIIKNLFLHSINKIYLITDFREYYIFQIFDIKTLTKTYEIRLQQSNIYAFGMGRGKLFIGFDVIPEI